ncbi:hypothetical protein YWS52_06780 [Chitiniphilus shinanonensis]
MMMVPYGKRLRHRLVAAGMPASQAIAVSARWRVVEVAPSLGVLPLDPEMGFTHVAGEDA